MNFGSGIYGTEDYSKGAQFLRHDLLHNYELILALEANVPDVPRDVFIYETDSVQGVMSIDTFRPDWVWVSIEALTENAALGLLENLPPGQEFNFLVHREWMKPLAQQIFGVEFTGRRSDYTVDQERFRPIVQHDVRELTGSDVEILERYPDDGGKAPRLIDLLDWQSKGVKIRMFGIIDNGNLVAHAIIDSDIDEIWGVHPFTPEQYRDRGYGKSTMSLATQAILDMGKIPYYDAGPGNPPAMKLAERLGYYVYQEVASGKGMR